MGDGSDDEAALVPGDEGEKKKTGESGGGGGGGHGDHDSDSVCSEAGLLHVSQLYISVTNFFTTDWRGDCSAVHSHH